MIQSGTLKVGRAQSYGHGKDNKRLSTMEIHVQSTHVIVYSEPDAVDVPSLQTVPLNMHCSLYRLMY